MHQVGAHESDEFEEAVLDFGNLSQHLQKQVSDQRDCDLDAHGILGTPDEVADLQRLLHQAEEQLNLPAPFVQVGDLLSGGVEIVGENAQSLAGVGGYDDLAHRVG